MAKRNKAIEMTQALARAAATDAANRAMKKAGRTAWSKADYNLAARTFNKLWKPNPGTKRNPATAALEAYEDFHGRESAELVTVSEPVHYHKHLASVGTLRKLVIEAPDGSKVSLSNFGKALLCVNEKGNQLFVRGGDQSVSLKEFGISTPHEVETLGRALSIDYKTVKDHLGDEGGDAVYRHDFRTTNENGKHVTVRNARCPDVIYRVRDKQLEFSGGSYVIRAEGIDK